MNLLIWDFDGTLGYRQGGMYGAALLEAIHDVAPEVCILVEQIAPFLQSGFPWHTPEIAHCDIVSPDAWWERLYPLFQGTAAVLGVPGYLTSHVARQVRRIYTRLSSWRLFDDVLPTLAELRAQGWTHLLLSNHVPELPAIVRHLGLNPHLAAVYNSAETGYEKPHPEAFRQILKAFPEANRACMVGDSLVADVRGAEGVGLSAVLVRKDDHEATFFCRDLGGLPRILIQIESTFRGKDI